MPDGANTTQCTVGLLTIAAQLSYRVGEGDAIDLSNLENTKLLSDLWDCGYEIAHSIAPKVSKGTGTTPIAAITLAPQDPTAPIVISFRGTKTLGDVSSDLHLGSRGVVGKPFREAAFEYYQNVRKAHPDREIILTGHSLGGHLAAYVATKAYNIDPILRSNPILQVRTFNTAPVSTRHSEVFKEHPELKDQFVNYRLSTDVVSNLPLQQYTGNTFVFPCKKGALAAHILRAVREDIPPEILSQPVGRTNDTSQQHNRLVELINGAHHSYQCYVKGQFFSRYREEGKDLSKMDEHFPIVQALLQEKKYENAIGALTYLSWELKSDSAKRIVASLIESTKAVQAIQPKSDLAVAPSPPPPPPGIEAQKSMKSALAEMRGQAPSTVLQEMPDADSPAPSPMTPSI